MQKAFSVMQTGAAPLLVFMVVFAPQSSRPIGGDNFDDSIPILQVLMLGVVISYLAAVCAQGLIALNRQKLLFWLSIIGLAANGALNALLIPSSAASGPHGPSWAPRSWPSACWCGSSRSSHGSRGRCSWGVPHRAPRPTAAVGLIKLVPGVDSLPSIVVLAVGGVLCGVVYLGSLYALRAVPAGSVDERCAAGLADARLYDDARAAARGCRASLIGLCRPLSRTTTPACRRPDHVAEVGQPPGPSRAVAQTGDVAGQLPPPQHRGPGAARTGRPSAGRPGTGPTRRSSTAWPGRRSGAGSSGGARAARASGTNTSSAPP